jgi:BON domain-containing protein
MSATRKIRTTVLAAALAASATAAFSADPVVVYTTPATTYYYTEPIARTYEPDALARYYYSDTAPTYYYTAPTYYEPVVTTTVYEAPPITVTAPRLTEDQAITRDVADTIASDPRISGRVGVETRRNVVSLSGVVTSSHQADLAARDAQGVPGVWEVNNGLRARVGGTR